MQGTKYSNTLMSNTYSVNVWVLVFSP